MQSRICVYDNIRQLLTMQPAARKQGRGAVVADLGLIEDAAVAVEGDTVRWVGAKAQLPKEFADAKRMSAQRSVWLPALVECHTHLVYGGSRHGDFARRCAGKTYQEIAQAGGGILSTVRDTRAASLDRLVDRARVSIAKFADHGVGCLEIKSGYGLTLDSEIKILEAVEILQRTTHVKLIPTFLPAHAVPPEYKGKTDSYVDAICDEWIPLIAHRKLAVFFDAFVEEGYFSVAQTRKMAKIALDHGLRIKLHVDQFTDQNATALGVELGAVSCDHLEKISASGIRALAGSNTAAVLAPGASLFTGLAYPPARALLDAGAIVALSTDFNPGTCPSHNLPLMLTLACTQMRFTVAEALVAATVGAAHAVGAQDTFGSIEAGRPFHVWQLPIDHYEQVPYRFGEV